MLNKQIGPGHYDSQLGSNKKGTEWAKYKSKRVEVKSAEKAAIGPGAYNPLSQPFVPMYKKNKNSVFASQVPKAASPFGNAQISQRNNEEESDGDEEEDDVNAQVPGPGHYYNPKTQTAFRFKEVPVDRQYFGSTVDRFQKKPIANQELNIGPGFYGDFRSNYQSKKAKAPFLSKKMRFNSASDENPGPGFYKSKGIKETVKEKTWGRQGVFGSTEKRFAPPLTNEVFLLQENSRAWHISTTRKRKEIGGYEEREY
jgi:hypothetical protein